MSAVPDELQPFLLVARRSHAQGGADALLALVESAESGNNPFCHINGDGEFVMKLDALIGWAGVLAEQAES